MEIKQGGYYIVKTKNTSNICYTKFFIIESTEKTILYKDMDQMTDNRTRLSISDFKTKFEVIEEVESAITGVVRNYAN